MLLLEDATLGRCDSWKMLLLADATVLLEDATPERCDSWHMRHLDEAPLSWEEAMHSRQISRKDADLSGMFGSPLKMCTISKNIREVA
jgi:hypothetical protein